MNIKQIEYSLILAHRALQVAKDAYAAADDKLEQAQVVVDGLSEARRYNLLKQRKMLYTRQWRQQQ